MALQLVFNPFTATLDYIDISSSNINWLAPVATFSALPLGDPDGASRSVKDQDAIYTYNNASATWIFAGLIQTAVVGATPNVDGYSVSINNTLTLQPADATHPGALTAIAQTIGGVKTFNAQIDAQAGIDRATVGTLSIGTSSNSNIINIGNSGATVNIQGTTIYENVSTLNVSNPLINLNVGGGVGSGSNSGMAIQENSIVTAYNETSADRNSWILKAPNTAGIATITPGASGITLAGSVTNGTNSGVNTGDANTLTTQVTNNASYFPLFVGASSSSTQAVDVASGIAFNPSTNTLTTTNFSGNASSATNAANVTTLATTTNATFFPTFVGSSSSGSQAIDISSGIGFNPSSNNLTTTTFTGALVGNASTATLAATASTTLNVNTTASVLNTNFFPTFVASSSTGTQSVETGSGITFNPSTNNLATTTFTGALSGNATSSTTSVTATNANNVATTASSTNASFFPLFVGSSSNSNQPVDLGTGLTFNPSTNTLTTASFVGAVTGASSGNLAKSVGDIDQTSFTPANNQAAPTNVTGLLFANATVRSFEALVSVAVIASSSLYESFKLYGIQRGADWQLSSSSVGDQSGFTFSITTSGQIQYTDSNYTGFSSAVIKFRAITTAV